MSTELLIAEAIESFKPTGDLVRLDQKKRVSIGAALKDGDPSYFQIYRNQAGQILLSPVLTVERSKLLSFNELNEIRTSPTQALMDAAISRGCSHFKGYASADINKHAKTLAHIPSEVIGCALLDGPLPACFDRIRLACMLLSNKTISPQLVWLAASALNVTTRLRAIVDLAMQHDKTHEPNWQQIINLLPPPSQEELPGLSRLSVETHYPKRSYTWLKAKLQNESS